MSFPARFPFRGCLKSLLPEPGIAKQPLRHHLQPHSFVHLQASDDVEQIRRSRIPLRPKHLVQRLHMNPGLLRQRGKAQNRADS